MTSLINHFSTKTRKLQRKFFYGYFREWWRGPGWKPRAKFHHPRNRRVKNGQESWERVPWVPRGIPTSPMLTWGHKSRQYSQSIAVIPTCVKYILHIHIYQTTIEVKHMYIQQNKNNSIIHIVCRISKDFVIILKSPGPRIISYLLYCFMNFRYPRRSIRYFCFDSKRPPPNPGLGDPCVFASNFATCGNTCTFCIRISRFQKIFIFNIKSSQNLDTLDWT